MELPVAPNETLSPLYYVLGVYETDPGDIESLDGLETDPALKTDPPLSADIVKVLPAFGIKLKLDILSKGYPSHEIGEKSPKLIEHIRSVTRMKDGDHYPPIIFIGLGFGALVTMKAVLSTPELTPMGVVLSSVVKTSSTGKSTEFKTWYNNLTAEGNKDLPELKKVLRAFNNRCRIERIRFSYIFRHKEHDFISKYLRYGKPYEQTEEYTVLKILENHIKKSWPEKLLEMAKSASMAAKEDSVQMVKMHRGEHCHEPMIARVLQQAAKDGKLEIIRLLLDDKVHPDVRVKQGDKTAFELAKDPEIRKLLYERGAKVHPVPVAYPFTYWQGLDSTPSPGDRGEEHEIEDKVGSGMGNEEFRALIVDIYSPLRKETDKCSKKDDQKGEDRNSKSATEPGDHELHYIAHPTVEELIYTKGPEAIMQPTSRIDKHNGYRRFRWIHIPMNHMTWLRDLVKVLCNEHCEKHSVPPVPGLNVGSAKFERHDSSANCNESCCQTYENVENTFPFIPGCADSIFEARYWLGQQDTPGTDEYSHIRSLRSQFRRLALVNSQRTGFAVVMPYVHFDTYANLKKMKRMAATQAKAQRHLLPSTIIPRLDATEKTWIAEDSTDESGDEQGNENYPYGSVEKKIDTDQEIFPKSTIKVLEKDLYKQLPLHSRKTLSQFYYYSRLQKTKQIITSHFKEKWPNEDALTLMVDQLWMLVLVDGTIITCFPSQMCGVQGEFPYIYTDVVEELLAHLRNRWRSPIATQLDLGFMIIKECIGFLFNQRSRHNRRFRFLNIYEQELSDSAADEVDCFETLTAIIRKLPDPGNPDYEAQARVCLQKLLKLHKEMRLMKKLKHIRRELLVILQIVTEQRNVIEQMTDDLESGEYNIFESTDALRWRRKRRICKLEKRRQQILGLDAKAETIFKDLELSTRRKEQQVRNLQAFFSSRLAQRSVRSGNVIVVFTLVTIVFAPLTFLAAFFALQIDEFPHAIENGALAMPLAYASRWIFGIGAAIFVPIIGIAMNINWITKQFGTWYHTHHTQNSVEGEYDDGGGGEGGGGDGGEEETRPSTPLPEIGRSKELRHRSIRGDPELGEGGLSNSQNSSSPARWKRVSF